MNVETATKLTAAQVRDLGKAENVIVIGRSAHDLLPRSTFGSSTPTSDGSARTSPPSAIDLWIVSDNLLKGAALNAVQIAERL